MLNQAFRIGAGLGGMTIEVDTLGKQIHIGNLHSHALLYYTRLYKNLFYYTTLYYTLPQRSVLTEKQVRGETDRTHAAPSWTSQE